MPKPHEPKPRVFSPYQVFVVAVLAFLQFTIVLDFMILSPLGAILLEALHISTAQFGFAVSAYAIAAGLSGILAAGFADRFDRKRLLLFFYTGFVLGTALCGVAPSYHVLVAGRIITGFFGGVISAISLAIVADLFALEVRGRVMGFVQSAFAASQVLGIPVGIYLATKFGWHAPFLLVAGVAVVVGFVIAFKMRPVDAHVAEGAKKSPFQHLWRTAMNRHYQAGFGAMILLTTGGFMLMPFGSAFTVNNLGIPLEKLTLIYTVTGACSIFFGPLVGRISDRYGKYRVFCYGTLLGVPIVLFYTRLGATPITEVILINIVLFVSIMGRMVTSNALNSAMPEPRDRGAYMSINASVQQFSGAIASSAAGHIVVQASDHHLEHYPVLGYVVAVTMIVSMLLMGRVNRLVMGKASPAVPMPEAA